MSLESVRAFFAEKAPDIAVIESPMSSATVALAGDAYGVEPGRIAKTLSLRIGDLVVLIVAAGTSRMDNKKLKARFGAKPKMLGLEEVADITGHEVGGVCPFGLKTPLPVYCDVSLRAFDEVVPAAGSTHSAVRIAPARIAKLTAAEWVNVCERTAPAAGRPIDRRRSSTARRGAGAPPDRARWHWTGTPRGTARTAAGCFAAGRPRCGRYPVSFRRTAGKRPACRPFVVQMSRGFPRKPEIERRCRRQSTSQDRGQFVALACPILVPGGVDHFTGRLLGLHV